MIDLPTYVSFLRFHCCVQTCGGPCFSGPFFAVSIIKVSFRVLPRPICSKDNVQVQLLESFTINTLPLVMDCGWNIED